MPGARASGGLLLQREPVLKAGGDGAGGLGGLLSAERDGLEGLDPEVLTVWTGDHRGGATLLRVLALCPRGHQLVALPHDFDGLQGADAGRRVVEARAQHSLGLATRDLAVCCAVVATGGDEDADDHSEGDHRDDDQQGEPSLDRLRVVVGLVGDLLVLALVHPGRDEVARVGLAGTGGGHFFDHSFLVRPIPIWNRIEPYTITIQLKSQ